MQFVLLGVVLLVCLYVIGRGLLNADPKALARAVRIGAVVAVVCVVGLLALTGRLGMAIGAMTLLLPTILRWRAIANRIKAARGPTAGGGSEVETRYLRMRLDHDTGTIDGDILDGSFKGRRLADLSVEELIRLRAECAGQDPSSLPLLEGYLDRVHGDVWRGRAGGEGEGGDGDGDGDGARTDARDARSGIMTREEAYEILGLEPGAGPQEIKDAHRRLMMRNHPDQGGSTYIAAKINQAKDVLLRA